MIGVIIYASGVTERRDFGPDCSEQSDMIHEIVGGYFEVMSGPDNSTIWMNEDGRQLELPRNSLASRAFVHHLAGQYPLVGNVIVTGSADQYGEATDIDEQLEKFLMQGGEQ